MFLTAQANESACPWFTATSGNDGPATYQYAFRRDTATRPQSRDDTDVPERVDHDHEPVSYARFYRRPVIP